MLTVFIWALPLLPLSLLPLQFSFSRVINPKSETCPKTKGRECRESPTFKVSGGGGGERGGMQAQNLYPGLVERSPGDRVIKNDCC